MLVVRVSESGELHQPSTIVDQGPSASRGILAGGCCTGPSLVCSLLYWWCTSGPSAGEVSACGCGPPELGLGASAGSWNILFASRARRRSSSSLHTSSFALQEKRTRTTKATDWQCGNMQLSFWPPYRTYQYWQPSHQTEGAYSSDVGCVLKETGLS